MQASFKNRIALINTYFVSVLMLVVFALIYGVVYYSAMKHLDDDIKNERKEILKSLSVDSSNVFIKNTNEWNEYEHNKLQANPVFIQVNDLNSHILFKSNNFQTSTLDIKNIPNETHFYNASISHQRLRIGKFQIKNNQHQYAATLLIGISRQESYIVLQNLLYILLFSYLVVLLTLFVLMWFAASKAIQPIQQIINKASQIRESNIQERLPLPINHDEIWQLAKTMNELLDRLDNSIHLQKQFTADISHEMRTPLTAIQGTLEVLLRKNRSAIQYEEKLHDVLHQTTRLSSLYDEMLELAKLDAANFSIKIEPIKLYEFIAKQVVQFEEILVHKNLHLEINIPKHSLVHSDTAILNRIITNLFSNAIKYSNDGGSIYIDWDQINKKLCIIDHGIGIETENLPFIFDRYFRVNQTEISGHGIGLFLVKKLCDYLNIQILVQSEINQGSIFTLNFPTKS